MPYSAVTWDVECGTEIRLFDPRDWADLMRPTDCAVFLKDRTTSTSLPSHVPAFDDITAWCLLAVVTVIARPGAAQNLLPWRFAALVTYILAMVFLVRPILRRVLPATAKPDLGRFGLAMILLLFSAWATEALAVHALFGAFLAGLVVPKGGELEQELRERLESVTVVLLLPLFFAFTALRTCLPHCPSRARRCCLLISAGSSPLGVPFSPLIVLAFAGSKSAGSTGRAV